MKFVLKSTCDNSMLSSNLFNVFKFTKIINSCERRGYELENDEYGELQHPKLPQTVNSLLPVCRQWWRGMSQGIEIHMEVLHQIRSYNLVVTIFSNLTISSTSEPTERKFSTQGRIHTKTKNRLLTSPAA